MMGEVNKIGKQSETFIKEFDHFSKESDLMLVDLQNYDNRLRLQLHQLEDLSLNEDEIASAKTSILVVRKEIATLELSIHIYQRALRTFYLGRGSHNTTQQPGPEFESQLSEFLKLTQSRLPSIEVELDNFDTLVYGEQNQT